MRTTFISTVYNEQNAIIDLIDSILSQTKKPDEIIIVDGGSTDNTLSIISNYFKKHRIVILGSQATSDVAEATPESNQVKSRDSKQARMTAHAYKVKLLIKKGNRAVGRNEAIINAGGDIIVCSDSGCILDKNWVQNITEHFKDPKVDVVAGYYMGKQGSVFEKCLVPYVLVMKDKITPKNFLPASRSMAFKKSIWRKAGGFPEEFSHNEDYVFAKRLRKINANIVFEKKAIVYWIPRSNIRDAFIMFYRFAKGDSESHIFRPKVIIIFCRYIIGIFLFLLFVMSKSYLILNTLYLILLFYFVWSIVKNYKYVKNVRAIFLLPLIQVTSDIAVILGTIEGLFFFIDFD